jgi:hypothetical protein
LYLFDHAVQIEFARPVINLQEYGDPELFVEEYKSKGGIDSNSSISVGLNENTFKSSISTDLRMFDRIVV